MNFNKHLVYIYLKCVYIFGGHLIYIYIYGHHYFKSSNIIKTEGGHIFFLILQVLSQINITDTGKRLYWSKSTSQGANFHLYHNFLEIWWKN